MSSSPNGFFIPVVFPDEDDASNNFSAPFMGHGGFILVNPANNIATCYEYGNTQTNSDPKNTNPHVISNPTSGALRVFQLSGAVQYDGNGNITESSMENMLSQITSTNYASSDPGIVFASPFAITQAQYIAAANQISTVEQKIQKGSYSPYSVFYNNCLNFTYDIAASIGLTISSSQTISNSSNNPISAWPNILVKNILAVNNFGYEYTAANSWNGQSIAEVNAQNYVTQTYIHDQFQLLVDSSAFTIPILDGYLVEFLVGKVIGELSDNIGSGGASFSATSNQLGNGALQLNENDGLGDQLVETLGTTSTVIGLVVNGQSSGGVGVSVIKSNAITPALSNGSELVVGSNGGFTFTANASLQTFLDIGGTNADFIGGSFSDLTEIVNPGTVSGTTIGSSSNNTFSFSGGTNVLIGDLGHNTFVENLSATSAINIIYGGGGVSTYELSGLIDILYTKTSPTPQDIEDLNLSTLAATFLPADTIYASAGNITYIIDPNKNDVLELPSYQPVYPPGGGEVMSFTGTPTYSSVAGNYGSYSHSFGAFLGLQNDDTGAFYDYVQLKSDGFVQDSNVLCQGYNDGDGVIARFLPNILVNDYLPGGFGDNLIKQNDDQATKKHITISASSASDPVIALSPPPSMTIIQPVNTGITKVSPWAPELDTNYPLQCANQMGVFGVVTSHPAFASHAIDLISSASKLIPTITLQP